MFRVSDGNVVLNFLKGIIPVDFQEVACICYKCSLAIRSQGLDPIPLIRHLKMYLDLTPELLISLRIKFLLHTDGT